MPTITETDKAEIDQLIRKFFHLFNNKNGVRPNLERIFTLCIPEAIIIKKNGLDQVVYDLKGFIEPREKILTDGTLVDFEEFEITERTVISHHIAQRQSRYQKHGCLDGKFFSEFGMKFFHLVKTASGWRISSVNWEDDKPK